ncbi:Thioredoxin [Musa troglodytarum]|uniref:Thioredoxin n=1 Tax=Musa troglodytarum TaxID=320322 RepID=A0A9E7HRT3_9LILI|nr:Thioredoxin [Musa troglodytarum]
MGNLFSRTSNSLVITIHSKGKWNQHWQSHLASNKLMVIDFSSSTCGPCRFIEPEVNAMAARYTEIEFVKIDVMKLPVAEKWDVRVVPTFVLVKRGKEVGRVVGADKKELEETIQQQQQQRH